MSESDEELVRRARKGDRAAFEELVRRTSRLIFARAYVETGDTHRAEDLVQGTMLRAYRSIAQLKDSRGFRQWLLRIVENLAIDGARRDRGRRRIGERANPSELSTVEARDDAPEKQAEIAESRAKVLAVLRSLPDEYRLPLMLRYIGGADYDAIATQLGMTNGALRGALHRGLRMMRERLGGQ